MAADKGASSFNRSSTGGKRWKLESNMKGELFFVSVFVDLLRHPIHLIHKYKLFMLLGAGRPFKGNLHKSLKGNLPISMDLVPATIWAQKNISGTGLHLKQEM